MRETTDWPQRVAVVGLLRQQLVRMLELFRSEAHRLAGPDGEPPQRGTLAATVIHGLHDEARHQGEMYLLLKLRRASAS